MKIGIVTQPLQANYGGILQNYALQQVLKRMGHEPITIDFCNRISIFRFVISSIRSLIFLCNPQKKRPFAKFKETRFNTRKDIFNTFIKNNITKTVDTNKYRTRYVKTYALDVVITGSDQVWRPMYNKYIEDMYLRFVTQKKVIKIAYAVSFGTNEWEYTDRQTERCKYYAQKISAISVREKSAIELCKKYLSVDAVDVLDPTMLLTVEDYKTLCWQFPTQGCDFIGAYILDLTHEDRKKLEKLYSDTLDVRIIEADDQSVLTVEEWLLMFRDAKYVVTNSFHGTVFSILFNKPFVCVRNERRGNARFNSLLEMFGLESRLVERLSDDLNAILFRPIDWERVNSILANKRTKSIEFLTKALMKKKNA